MKIVQLEAFIMNCHQFRFYFVRFCGKLHERYRHWGSLSLKERIHDIKPKYHLYGHVHDEPGFTKQQETYFVNSAVDIKCVGHYFDYYV